MSNRMISRRPNKNAGGQNTPGVSELFVSAVTLCANRQRLAANSYRLNVPTNALRFSWLLQVSPKPGPWYSSVTATAGTECASCVSGG